MEGDSSSAWHVGFNDGGAHWRYRSYAYDYRVFALRAGRR
jgi:hypothetical protein